MYRRAAIALLSLITALSVTGEELIKPSIVGGQNATTSAYPWMVALVRADAPSPDEGQFCGGVLVAPGWILTAAHCLDNYDFGAFQVLVGNGDLNGGYQLLEPSAVLIHPEADLRRIERGCDIALIKLAEPFLDVDPIPLNRALSIIVDGRSVTAIGWGSTAYDADEDTTSSLLKEIQLALYVDDFAWPDDPIYDLFVTTDDSSAMNGTAQGDSGGPLIIRNPDDGSFSVVGVTSFGLRNDSLNISHYANVAYAANWIDSVIAPSSSLATELPATNRIQTGIRLNGKSYVGYQIWPFANNIQEDLFFQNSSAPPSALSFNLQTQELLYLQDGSFLFLHPQENWIDQRTSLLSIRTHERPYFNNAPLPLLPYQRYEGSQQPQYRSFGQTGITFQLQNLDPNFEYEINGNSFLSFTETALYEIENNRVRRIAYSGLAAETHFQFQPKPTATYLLQTNAREDETTDFQLALRPTTQNVLTDSTTLHGELTTDSHPFKTTETRVEQVEYQGNQTGEVELSVYSEFDTELALYDKKTNALTGYYDYEIEGMTETFIVSAQSLKDSVLQVFNFDKSATGSFSISTRPHTDAPLTFSQDLQYAITPEDENYQEDDGTTVYFDSHTLRAGRSHNFIKIEIRGQYFEPALAVLFNDNVLEFEQDGRYLEYEFEVVPNREYKIRIYNFEEYLNSNYFITITGSQEATLSATADPTPAPSNFKKRITPQAKTSAHFKRPAPESPASH